MRKRKLMSVIVVAGMIATLIAGCNGENKENEGNKEGEAVTTVSDADYDKDYNTASVISDIKSKYEDEETLEYTAALYNLERNHIFTYDITEQFFERDEYDCFKIFYDAELTNEVNINIEADYDTMKRAIRPGLVFDYNEDGSCIDDSTWGTRSKFYLVQYVDEKTGKDLEKPVVTVFTLKDELITPTLSQKMGLNGYYELSWTEVEGADFYEVYELVEGNDATILEVTTEKNVCDYSEFATSIRYQERFEETYGGTEIDVTQNWRMNGLLDVEAKYFVVAKNNDGKASGMSNECKVSDVANQIPVTVSDEFITEYEGDSALVLPAYADVEMADGSIGKFLIQYTGATATLLEDGRIIIDASFKNLPIEMYNIQFTGMDFDTFIDEAKLLKEREEELDTKSVTSDKNINIPFVPGNSEEITVPYEPEEETTQTPSLEIMESIYGNTALSEWIAVNLLSHNEEISLEDFPESTDTEYLKDAFFEAYTQNPLCGIVDTLNYSYSKKALIITYVMSKEETAIMQSEAIAKANSIVDEIIEAGMTDYEKENDINQYLCDNASYNDKIIDYINADGTLSDNVVYEFTNSFTPYGVLVENTGVCEAYSEAFQLLGKLAGLEVVIETGRLNGVSHEWNRVKIDGNWCIIDVTNNDNEYLPNAYFNLSDEASEDLLIPDGEAFIDEYIEGYRAETMEYEYYIKNNLYADDENTAVEMLIQQLGSKDMAVVRVNEDYDDNTVYEIVQSAVNEACVENGMYYYINGIVSVVKQ